MSDYQKQSWQTGYATPQGQDGYRQPPQALTSIRPVRQDPFHHRVGQENTTVRAADGTALAMIDWDHSSPVVHYLGKKLRCKEWIVWVDAKRCLEPADLQGYPILIWRDPMGQVEVEAFQESLIIPGLLETAVIGVMIEQTIMGVDSVKASCS
ncbi:hypothetical protein BJV78DRAFT_1282022 [Lactifluus subvellereus]|nr:hypothetical protein BJV78DRAFT_1282022 [Lactifluus subvellereus]